MNDLLATPDFSETAAVWAEVSPALGYGPDSHKLHLSAPDYPMHISGLLCWRSGRAVRLI